MKNPELMLLRRGHKFLAVVVGDTYQGPKRGWRRLPGQPDKGLPKRDAIAVASAWNPEKILAFCGDRVGSYVRPHVKEALIPVDAARAKGGEAFTRERTETKSIDIHTTAQLIENRRATLKQLAEIDLRLKQCLQPQVVEALQKGMERPLAN